MSTRDVALSELENARAGLAATDESFRMDDERFRAFYDRTSRPLWSYLSRASGDRSLADDLVQESYFRLLGARLPAMDEEYLRNYLFQIASNLLRDHWRREGSAGRSMRQGSTEALATKRGADLADAVQRKSDLDVGFRCLKPRERQLLWLAYVEGASHREIAAAAGLKEGSVRLLLFRARRRLAGLLRSAGLHS